jgi:hypothetical protein
VLGHDGLAEQLFHLRPYGERGVSQTRSLHQVTVASGAMVPSRVLEVPAHPDGPAAHLARQRALTQAGWRLRDAFANRWNADPRRAALELAAGLSAG